MSANKKQHYVPQFYLKLFSNRQEGNHLGLYKKEGYKFIGNAGLKGQAYGVFFYGKDGKLEKQLSEIEGNSKSTINEIISNNKFPHENDVMFRDILFFCLLQAYRTKARVKEMDSMLNAAVKQIFSHDPKIKDKIDEINLSINNAPVLILESLIRDIKLSKGLTGKLLVNNTKKPFITSDHPVVKYNQFLEKRNHYGGWTGLASKGLQLFYPISDKYLLMFYDKKIYKYSDKNKNIIEVTNENDIDQLNSLQLINCDELVFFNERITEEYIKNLHKKNEKFMRDALSIAKEYPQNQNPDGSSTALLHVSQVNIKMNMQLSFIKETKEAKQYQMSGYAVEVRDEKIRNRRS